MDIRWALGAGRHVHSLTFLFLSTQVFPRQRHRKHLKLGHCSNAHALRLHCPTVRPLELCRNIAQHDDGGIFLLDCTTGFILVGSKWSYTGCDRPIFAWSGSVKLICQTSCTHSWWLQGIGDITGWILNSACSVFGNAEISISPVVETNMMVWIQNACPSSLLCANTAPWC